MKDNQTMSMVESAKKRRPERKRTAKHDSSLVRYGDEDSFRLLTDALDRSLPVPLRTQLGGLIKYGISCGALRAGAKLPSVRALAEATGLAPMTVASAYRALRAAGALVTRPGAGTFVAEAMVELAPNGRNLRRIEKQVDEILIQAQQAGLSMADVAAMLHVRATRSGQGFVRRSVHIMMVGIFEEATKAYARDLAGYLKAGDRVDALTIEQLTKEQLKAHPSEASPPDLYVTLPTRLREVAALVEMRAPVTSINVIPSAQTRAFLAAIDPGTTLGIVSVFPGFIALMKQSVLSFAPHVRNVVVGILNDADLGDKLRNVDVVVYATGADQVLDRIPPGTITAEYRHVPDPNAVHEALLPLVEQLREVSR